MKKYKYDEIYINRYKMINQFYTKRFPLIILISGTVYIGKSTIATKLSERMNISNVLQTKVISDVMGYINDNYSVKPFYMNEDITTEVELIEHYLAECKIIRKGTNYDIQKAFLEGKALIIEGHHIVPNYYINKSDTGTINIITPEPDNETNREKIVREEMNNIVQCAIIIPFLLTADEKTQIYLLKNYGLYFEGENISFNVCLV